MEETSSPKLRSKSKLPYRYYAGFSRAFVENTLATIDLPARSIVLDPWNGSGTTTLVASSLGHSAIGVDINPAMTIVSRGSTRWELDHAWVMKTLDQVISDAIALVPQSARVEALCPWFDRSTAYSIASLLMRCAPSTATALCSNLTAASYFTDSLSDLESLLVAGLIVALQGARSQPSSNPTWVKAAGSEKKSIPWSQLCRKWRDSVGQLLDLRQLSDSARLPTSPQVLTGTSTQLAIASTTVDVVIGSPPYCTRIDYAIKTRVELALLGLTSKDFSELRHGMIGTTTIGAVPETEGLPSSVLSILDSIKSHPSKASQSYYYKFFCQYFANAFQSLNELDRVLKPGGSCILVVQPSRYKDLTVDLPNLYLDMGESLGWSAGYVERWPAKNTMSSVNPRALKYGKPDPTYEYVLNLQKPVVAK